MRTYIFAFALVFLAAPAFAATLKPGYPVCLDYLSVDQFQLARNNPAALNRLLGRSCGISTAPQHVTVLGWSAGQREVNISVTKGNQSMEAWTVKDAIQGLNR